VRLNTVRVLKIVVLLLCFNQVLAEDFQIFYENGKAGLKNPAGEIVLPAKYEALGWSNGSLNPFEQSIGFKENNLWGVINLQNEVTIPATYHYIVPFNTGYYKASLINRLIALPKTGIINQNGKTIISFNYDDLIVNNNKIIAVNKSNEGFVYGLIDYSEKIIIPIRHKDITSIGSLRYAVKNHKDKIAIFSESGKSITDFDIDSITTFQYNRAKFYKELLCGLINREGSIIEPAIYADIDIKEDGIYFLLPENKWNVIQANNNIINSFNADDVALIGGSRYRLTKANHHTVLNEKLESIAAAWFPYISEVNNEKIIFKSKGKYGLMDLNHNIQITASFDSLSMLNNLLAGRKSNFGVIAWGLFDFNGERQSEHYFESIKAYDNNYLITGIKNYVGLIDINGKEILPNIFEDILQVKHEKVVVKFHKQYGILNFKGDWLVGPSVSPLYILKDGYYLEKQSTNTFLKSIDGEIIYFSKNQLSDEDDYLIESWSDGKVWKIDLKGRIFAAQGNSPSLLFEAIYAPSEGFYGIKKDGRYGFVDDQNRLRIANRYEGIGSFKDGLAPIKIRGRWGFIDKYENIIIQPQYQQAEDFYKGISLVEREGKFGLIDLQGNQVISAVYNSIYRLENDFYVIEKNGEFGLASHSGKIVVNPSYDEIFDLNNGYVIVKRNNKYGLLTRDGLNTIPIVYDKIIFDKYLDRYFALEKAMWIKKDLP
jgi:hypothetical protein